MTALSLGAMTFGRSSGFMKGVTSSEREARAVLDRALDAGIDTIDTANVYSEGNSEALLGRWLAGRRDRIVLATKCRFPTRPAGPGEPRPIDAGLSRRAILHACEGSLRRLRTDRIDLYQVHMQDRAVPIEETLRALDDLVRSGKVRYVGCSNYAGYRLAEALGVSERRSLAPFVSVQLQWSLLARDAERELVPAARAFGLGVLAWSPLARGFLSGKYERGKAPPKGARLAAWRDTLRQYDNERAWSVLEKVREVARRRGTSPATVALAWLLRRPETSSVVLGARSVAQLEENLAAAELRLGEEDAKTLEEATRPAWGYPYDFIGAREPW